MITINQQTHGGEWRLIGVFSDIRSVVVANDVANGHVIADAVGFLTEDAAG